MKKDIEWLKEEIEEDIKSWGGGNPDYFRGASDAYENVKDWLNHIDEPETLSIDKEQLIKSIENYNTLYDETVGDVVEGILEIVKQLPEMRVLSKEWIDEHRESTFDLDLDEDFETVFVKVEDLQNLLVPKQEVTEEHGMSESEWAEVINRYKWHLKQEGYVVIEKPTVPRFIAEAIEEDKEAECDVYDSIYFIIETNGGGLPSISDWVAKNIDKYARAYLYGYTVEEQKYYVLNKNNKLMLRKYTGGVREPDISNSMTVDSEFFEFERFALTEQEIKDYDDRFWPFAVKVEELGEEE